MQSLLYRQLCCICSSRSAMIAASKTYIFIKAISHSDTGDVSEAFAQCLRLDASIKLEAIETFVIPWGSYGCELLKFFEGHKGLRRSPAKGGYVDHAFFTTSTFHYNVQLHFEVKTKWKKHGPHVHIIAQLQKFSSALCGASLVIAGRILVWGTSWRNLIEERNLLVEAFVALELLPLPLLLNYVCESLQNNYRI